MNRIYWVSSEGSFGLGLGGRKINDIRGRRKRGKSVEEYELDEMDIVV